MVFGKNRGIVISTSDSKRSDPDLQIPTVYIHLVPSLFFHNTRYNFQLLINGLLDIKVNIMKVYPKTVQSFLRMSVDYRSPIFH